jgi:hypothetical protein
MDIFVYAFAGGLLGALLMDITEMRAARSGITSGVNVSLVGRWFLYLLRGQFIHEDIRTKPALTREITAGWAFHFVIGGGGVALLYPLFLLVTGLPLNGNHLLGGLLFGLATSALPWLILLPSFGWCWFGRCGPEGSNALLASSLSHIPYGLGVGAVMMLHNL